MLINRLYFKCLGQDSYLYTLEFKAQKNPYKTPIFNETL